MAEATLTTEKIGKVIVNFDKPRTYIFRLTDNRKVKPMGVTEGGDVDPPYPRKYMLDNPCQTFDPVTKRPRWARCLKGIDTIWQDEQKDVPKEQIPSMLDEFVFVDGEMLINMPTEYSKLKYLMHHIKLQDNSPEGQLPVFYLVNDDEKAEKEYQLEQSRHEAEETAMEKNIEELLPLATYFGIKVEDSDGNRRKESALRLEFVKQARKNPKVFLDNLNSPKLKVAHAVKEAVDSGLIDLAHVKGQAHWGETKAFITKLDEKKSPVDSLVDFAFSGSKDSNAFTKKLGL